MHRHRLWICVVLTATVAAVCTIQLCRFRSAGPFKSGWFGSRTGGNTALSSHRSEPAPVYEFALFAGGSRAFCRTNRNHIEIRDVQSGETLDTLDYQGQLPITTSAMSKDGMVLVGYFDGSLVLWSVDAESGQHRPRLLGNEPSIACCAVSRDGRLAASGHGDGTVILRDTATGSPRRRWKAHAACVSCVRFSRDGTRLLSARRTTCLWDVRTGKRLALLPSRGAVLGAAELSPDGRFVISAHRNWGAVAFWYVETASEVWSTILDDRSATTIAFSPDGRVAAVGDTAGEVWLYEANSGQRITKTHDTTSIVSCIRFSADGQRLFVSRHDSSIRTWRLANLIDR